MKRMPELRPNARFGVFPFIEYGAHFFVPGYAGGARIGKCRLNDVSDIGPRGGRAVDQIWFASERLQSF